jgi:hypothetical protein
MHMVLEKNHFICAIWKLKCNDCCTIIYCELWSFGVKRKFSKDFLWICSFPKPINMPSHMRRFAKDSNMCCQNLPRQICKKASLGQKNRHGHWVSCLLNLRHYKITNWNGNDIFFSWDIYKSKKMSLVIKLLWEKKTSLTILGLVVSHFFNLAKWIETDEDLEEKFKRCIWTRWSVGKNMMKKIFWSF